MTLIVIVGLVVIMMMMMMTIIIIIADIAIITAISKMGTYELSTKSTIKLLHIANNY